MEHQFFIRQQNLKLYRSLVAASEVAAAKADARQEKLDSAPLTGRVSRRISRSTRADRPRWARYSIL
jgi:hypothetical protein